MHKILEKYILEEGYLDLTNVGRDAHNMAIRVIEQGLCNVPEYYGTECTLYYPGLYAGQTDLVGIHKGADAIIDFKQTNKPKKKEWVEDYYLQLVAYALAHNELYGTDIKEGHVFMCSRDLQYQQFDLWPEDFAEWESKWWDRVYEYYDKIA